MRAYFGVTFDAREPCADLTRQIVAIVEERQRERGRRIERAILERAEHGQRVEELRYHLDGSNLELRCELIVHGDVAHAVDLADLRPGLTRETA